MSKSEKDYDDELKEQFKEWLRLEMKASEVMEEMIRGRDLGEINMAAEAAVIEIDSRIQDEQMRQNLFTLLHRFGQIIGSESMAEAGARKLEQMVGEKEEA